MFELNGEEVTLDFLRAKASQYNMDFDSYLQQMKKQGLVEKQVGSTVDPTMSQDDMGSQLDDGSSASYDLPQVDVTGSQEDDTWIERTVGKNIVTDYFGDL